MLPLHYAPTTRLLYYKKAVVASKFQGIREKILTQKASDIKLFYMKTLNDILNESKYAVFFGGAGVSTPSNIPDFRGEKCISRAKLKWNLPLEELISHSFFVNHTADFFEFYRENMLYPHALPNIVHYNLASLEKAGIVKAVITQNIDDLHFQAGSKNVLELHGNAHRNYCQKCHKFWGIEKIASSNRVPLCDCGGIIKPDVVLYGEGLDDDVWERAAEEIQKADTLIVGGSSLVVTPAAYLVNMFKGENLVIINNQSTPYDSRASLLIHDDLVSVFSQIKIKQE